MAANNENRKKIICIGGPTGAGKSAAAAALGAALCKMPGSCSTGVVVNADSRQVYADFPIITAQPGQDETGLCPHILYGFLPTEEKISAGRYCELAAQAIDALYAENKIPILTGGTGLYFRSLLRGIADIPAIPEALHQKWQNLCAAEGSQALHARLYEVDQLCANKIHPNDRQRITRALEVYEGTGKPLSWWQAERTGNLGYNALFIGVGLELTELEPFLRRRIELMLETGAIREAEEAMRKCRNPQAPGWSGIGCAEIYRHLAGDISLQECVEQWLRNTRAYAKRQLTWFRAEQGMHWFRPGEHEAIIKLVSSWLSDESV